MGMLPPITKQAYASHNKKLYDSSLKEREASFSASEIRIDASEDDVIDITVTCDGTWARQGFQSLYCVVLVASWDTEKFWMWKFSANTARSVQLIGHGRVV